MCIDFCGTRTQLDTKSRQIYSYVCSKLQFEIALLCGKVVTNVLQCRLELLLYNVGSYATVLYTVIIE